MADPVRAALVGYGVGGRFFHAPFIEAADGIDVVTVVTRDPERRRQVVSDLPGVQVSDDLAAARRLGVEAAVITTPPATRRGLVLDALRHGLAVVADKPFAPDAAGARELARAADDADRPLAVYYNRRWDADVQTLKAVIESGDVGSVERFTARMDEDAGEEAEDEVDGGLLRDLGSHLVDQSLWLFGPVDTVFAELDERTTGSGGRIDTGFALSLRHVNGVRSQLEASKLNHAVQKELRLLGTRGSYRSDSSDVQATASRAGRRPSSDPADWGFEPERCWGVLRTAAGARAVPSARGAYQDFYSAFADAVRGRGAVPVPVQAAVEVARVLDAARRSALDGVAVRLSDEDAAARA